MGNFNILEHARVEPMKDQDLHFLLADNGCTGMLRATKTDVQSFFLTGDGVEKPLGILHGRICGDPVTRIVSRWEAGAIDADSLINMLFLHIGLGHGQWLLCPAAYDQAAKLRDASGAHILDGERGLLLGRPVHKCKQSPALGEVGDVLLADFRAYFVGEYKHDGEILRDGMPIMGAVQTSSGLQYHFVALGDALEVQECQPLPWRDRAKRFLRGLLI